MSNAEKEKRLRFLTMAKELVSSMTLDEKIKLMAANDGYKEFIRDLCKGKRYNERPYKAGGNERLGIPELSFCDGPRGVVSGNATCFPVAMCRGATFNRKLSYDVGEAIGEEVRASGGNFFAGICLNIPYNPGDGRSQETYGEDSYLIGEMGASCLKGVQSRNVAACIKHFAFNSMENMRFKVNVTADKRTEREVYFPHFKKCIDSGAACLMTSYNKYFGEHCGENKYLIRDVVKGEWKFDGPVMSDFLLGVYNVNRGINAGLDIEMRVRRVYSYRKIKNALRKKKITIDEINDAAVRITTMMLTYKDDKYYDKSVIASMEHIALAKKCADEGITLLKNDGMLPLKAADRIVLLGDLANEKNIGDHGSSSCCPPYITTVLDAFIKNYPDAEIKYFSTKDYKANLNIIREASKVITVCGNRFYDEGEYIPLLYKGPRGGDRNNLNLKPEETELINEVTAINKNVCVVLIGGNAILTNSWKDKVNSIIFAYYPGMEGGTSIADILYGKVNPSGKLPFVIGPNEQSYPEVDFTQKEIKYGYYHGYRKMDKDGIKPDFPFGYGLSYTSFKIENVVLSKSTKESACFDVTIKNTGDFDGAEVVQLYISFKNSKVDRPVKTLVAFEKVFLKRRESKELQLKVNKSDLAYFDEKQNKFVDEDIKYIANIGNNSCDSDFITIEYSFE